MNQQLKNKEEIINFWIKSSDKDYKTMNNLYSTNDYHWALFIGHLVIEKLLKAYYVKSNNKQPIPIHNLLLLAEKSMLEVPGNYEDWLDTITTFNINARYDSYAEEFYKLCTKKFTTEWSNNITELRKWIKKQLKKS